MRVLPAEQQDSKALFNAMRKPASGCFCTQRRNSLRYELNFLKSAIWDQQTWTFTTNFTVDTRCGQGLVRQVAICETFFFSLGIRMT